ncbi:MAG: C4-dicarboxylate TRAP transporter substrate-binding protein [Methylobacteriaceae bacterium]|nr:C4-dicarboxylate TRAP transporter substrate-binding protein [Methylobacteriaceae bacterium]
MKVHTIFYAALIASTAIGQAMAADFTLNVNTALTTDDPLYKGLETFRDEIAKRSEGKIEIKLFPNSQLGSDEDVIEQARAGAPVAVVVEGGRLANYVKEFGIMTAPYIAKSYEGVRKVTVSPLFAEWEKKLHDTAGLQVLSFNWSQGERQVIMNKPVKTPADLAGVRMRTPGAPVWIETVRAMGATPAPMPYSEVYSAMQQQVIDAVEAQIPAAYGSKLQEVAKHITKTHHIFLITGLVASGGWYDSLPDNLKTIVREEALKAGDVASYGTRDSIAGLEKKMEEAGVTFHEIDVEPFRKATEVVYDKLGYGELREQIQAIAEGN